MTTHGGDVPDFMLLIVYDPSAPADGSPSKQPEHAALEQEMRARGDYRGGGGLAPVEAYVRRVRQQAGRSVVLDGPFAETKEALGGYFIVNCSEAEALAYAARVPVDSRSWFEVRRLGIHRPL